MTGSRVETARVSLELRNNARHQDRPRPRGRSVARVVAAVAPGKLPMRLAYLSHEPLPSSSTYAEQLVGTVFELAGTGLDIEVIHPAPPGQPPRASDEVHRAVTEFFRPRGPEGDPEASPRFCELPHQGHPLHDLRATLRARRLRRYDLVYTRDLLALTFCLAARLPVVLDTFRSDLGSPRYGWWRVFSYRSRWWRGVVTHSRLAARSFVDAGFAESRVLVAYNGVGGEGRPGDPASSARVSLDLPLDASIVCYAGHLGPTKGTETLLEVAAAVPEATFVVVGGVEGSPGLDYARAAARRLGARGVRFFPRVPPPEVARYLAAADVLIIPPTAGPLERHRRTVLPMKTFRYLAAGRTVMAPRLRDLTEVLEHDRNAVLIPPDDVEAAAAALRALLTDGTRRQRLATAAREDARRFTWRRRAQAIADFLRRVA